MKQHPTIELLESLNSSVVYLIESATCLAVLYLLYYFFLRNEKSFHYNRAYLLVALFLSVSFPMMEFSYNPASTPGFFNSLHEIGNGVGDEPIIEAEKAYSYTITAKSERPFLLWWEALLLLYLVGFGLGLLKFLIRIRQFKEVIWYRRHNTRFKGNYFLVKTEGLMPTFSFFNYLFWDNSQQYTEREKEQIIAHEKAHIDQKHSYDILFIEILKIVFWFNPFMYLYKMLLEEVHEYAADQAVIGKESHTTYASLLVRTVFNKMGLEYGSYFGKNKTLKRLDMMKKVASTNYFKLLLPLPFIALLFFIFSFDALPLEKVKVDNYQVEASAEKEILPEPLIGTAEWTSFLEENILYPKAARDANVEGQVIISFDVNPNGYLEYLEFENKLGFKIEEAILQALRKSSKWKPGFSNGVPVTTRVRLPIEFKKS
ncbi:M56 family metallopeptidase [Roseivirga sp.]|uniref:M56 family metallopeptidase n=1 Tax=Roseivirga sp. TaxID=1964215 RepID=UPI003B516FA8